MNSTNRASITLAAVLLCAAVGGCGKHGAGEQSGAGGMGTGAAGSSTSSAESTPVIPPEGKSDAGRPGAMQPPQRGASTGK
jgi:hypothetical protein